MECNFIVGIFGVAKFIVKFLFCFVFPWFVWLVGRGEFQP